MSPWWQRRLIPCCHTYTLTTYGATAVGMPQAPILDTKLMAGVMQAMLNNLLGRDTVMNVTSLACNTGYKPYERHGQKNG